MTAEDNPTLEVRNVTKRFGNLQAVSEFSATIYGGEIVGLIGPNGAGKTTAFNIVSGFIRQDQGEVLWRGKSLGAMAPSGRAQLGLVRTFQHTRVFPNLTVFQNVLIGTHRLRSMRQKTQSCTALLETLGLDGIKDLPAKQLPYGSAKILSLGIALAAEPAILLLDEPAAGLNTYETEGLANMLRRIRRPELAIWIIEHNMSFVMSLCERILVLSAGRLIAHGTPEEVGRSPEVQEAYLGSADKILTDA
jgi:branched-chain amino acid transport system ATP-binding protein